MLLSNGSHGGDVRKLQQKLGLNPDGDFGSITENRVKQWQSEHNLNADGIINDDDWKILFPDEAFFDAQSSAARLKGHLPDPVLNQIPATASVFNISNSLRLAHFLAQCCHESGGFTRTSENLNYSADRLAVVFPRLFRDGSAAVYAYNPVKIGSKVYANILGNGDEQSGEGYKFRGRGFLQLTGKNNYKAFAGYIGEDVVAFPDLVADKYPLASAAYYFNANNIWSYCDLGSTPEVIARVTKCINKAALGLNERISHFREYYALIQ